MFAVILFVIQVGLKACSSLSNSPVVTTASGDIKGFTVVLPDGKIVHKFLAIPYAKPPVGRLRFRRPRPHQGWQGEIRDARQPGKACIQGILPHPLPPGIDQDEDCLSLNIYVPGSQGGNLSVMVYIHEGNFLWGTSWYYDGTKMATSGDVIIITINYRVDLLGWINSGDGVIKGNAGFFDQLAALKWVKNNIAAFGGNPNSITVFGLSSGGESVMAHIYSRLSRGLFSRAIVQSAPAAWQYPREWEQRQPFRDFAAYVNCSHTNTREVARCLRRLPAASLKSSTYRDTFPFLAQDIAFRVIDGKFLKHQPRDILESGRFNGVDLIIGFASHDGHTILKLGADTFGADFDDMLKHGLPQIPNFPQNAFLRLTVEASIGFIVSKKPYIFGPRVLEGTPNFALMINMVMHEYYADTIGDASKELQAAFDLTTSAMFAAYAAFIGDIWSQRNSSTASTYMYQFSHRSVDNAISGALIELGAFHVDDVYYLFDLLPFVDATDIGVQSALIAAWTSFAKTGQPTITDKTAWTEYNSLTKLFWNFNEQNGGAGTPETGVFAKDINFWNKLVTPVSQLHPICKV